MPINSQNKVITSGDNSPAVIAKSFSSTYGVRSEAIIEILNVYEQDGLNLKSRKKTTEEILKEFSNSPEKEKKDTKLSDATKKKLGIQKKPKILNALEWDLFSKNYHLKTGGDYSPAISASGDVFIWYGIPSKTLRVLAERLEDKNVTIENFESQLKESAITFRRLQKELDSYKDKDKIYDRARNLLIEGKLEEADRLIDSDFHTSRKRQAYKGFIYGLTKELLNDFKEAKVGYKNAIENDDSHLYYHLKYGEILMKLNQSKEAIIFVEKALKLLNQNHINENDYNAHKSIIFNQLGYNYYEIEDFDKAIFYHEESITLIKESYNEEHFLLGAHYVNLGRCWSSNDNLDKSIKSYKKALSIYSNKLGEYCRDNGIIYLNMGITYLKNDKINSAIENLREAEEIFLSKSIAKAPYHLGLVYYNLGKARASLKKYDDALEYFEQSEEILSAYFEVPNQYLNQAIEAIYLVNEKIGFDLVAQKKYVESNYYFNLAYTGSQKLRDNASSVYFLMNLGLNKIMLNLHNDALKDFNEALDLLSRTTTTNKNSLKMERHNIIEGKILCLEKLGKQKELNEFLIFLASNPKKPSSN